MFLEKRFFSCQKKWIQKDVECAYSACPGNQQPAWGSAGSKDIDIKNTRESQCNLTRKDTHIHHITGDWNYLVIVILYRRSQRKFWEKGDKCFNDHSMLRRELILFKNLNDDINIPSNLNTKLLVSACHILKFDWPTLLLLSFGSHVLQSNKFVKNKYCCVFQFRSNRRLVLKS